MRRILLVEPGYHNKYPPLGLMKISSYHKLAGDEVHFVKGRSLELRAQTWDRIYVATLFTFHWLETIGTIRYYLKGVTNPEDLIVGGVFATLLEEDIRRETGARVVPGLLDKPGILDEASNAIIDSLIPDYHMLDSCNYRYGVEDSYIAYATRGCPNRCDFCAVHVIEPEFRHYIPLPRQIKAIEEVYGEKQNLILLDNNVLASCDFKKIINDICISGFERGAKRNRKMRTVDFNQGIDARLLTEGAMEQLARTAIRPLRIAFDDIRMKKTYIACIRRAVNHNLLNLSNYILYNFEDTPEDFYERLKINCILNIDLGAKIYSFPMKFIPLTAKNRKYVGMHWNRKLIRGVQCILLATRGLVSPRLEFFEAAFGKTSEEFKEIALMPDEYIIHRRLHEKQGAADWRRLFRKLTSSQYRVLLEIHSEGKVTEKQFKRTRSARFRRLLEHYIEAERIEKARRDQSNVAK